MEENENLNPEPNKKSNKSLFIVVGLMAVIIVALVGYIMVSKSEDSNESKGENNTTTSSSSSESDKEKDSDKDDEDEEEEEEDEKEEKNTSKKNSKKNSSKDNTNTKDSKDDEDEEDEDDAKNTTSGFGKKDKNTTKESTTNTSENTTKDTTTEEKNTTAQAVSGDWKSGEFTLDGKAYKLNADYKSYTANGWSIDLKAAGYENGYILNKNDKIYCTVDLENPQFDDANVQVGFINLAEAPKDVTECQIWGISVNNKFADTPVDFTLAGGIKSGSTLAEIEAVYGKPTDESDIYRSEDLKYTTYTYDNELKPQLRLTIYDEGGLTGFEYKTY